MQTDEEVLKAALWIARDLSIKQSGEVPDVVREAPAALLRLLEGTASVLPKDHKPKDASNCRACEYADEAAFAGARHNLDRYPHVISGA